MQDGYYAKLCNEAQDLNKWYLVGIFNEKDEQVSPGDNAQFNYHKCNLSFAKLRGGGCLVGVRRSRVVSGALYKIDKKENLSQVGVGLKNFRLREIKSLTKTRK